MVSSMKVLAICLMFPSGTAGQNMKIGCLAEHCGLKLAKAMTDPNFMKNSKCEEGCNKIYNNDTTPEKLHYQNCTTTCAVTYESEAGDAFLACAMEHNCVTFPAIPGSCPKPTPDANTSLASLSGEWWQHRGHNPLWDCYSCQHIHSMYTVNDDKWCGQTVSPAGGPVKAPCWSYSYSYDLYLVNGSTKYFGQTWQLPGDVPKGEPIAIYYEYMGSYHNETWYILKATDRYVLLVDCSYMMSWVNVGSIVWVRPNITLTDAENLEIAEVYQQKLGWNYTSFCYTQHGAGCDGPAVSTRRSRPRFPLRSLPLTN